MSRLQSGARLTSSQIQPNARLASMINPTKNPRPQQGVSISNPNMQPPPAINPVDGGPLTSAALPVQPAPSQGPTTPQDLIGQLDAAGQASRDANLARGDEIRGLSQQVIDMFQPGGSFGQGFLNEIERLKTNTIAGQTQQAVSSGLFNTTTTGNLGAQFEANQGTQARLQLADMQAQRLAGAIESQAGFVERFEDVGPDPGLVAGLVTSAADQPGGLPTTVPGEEITDNTFKAESKRRRQEKKFTRQQVNLEKKVAAQEAKLKGITATTANAKKRTRLKNKLNRLNEQLTGTKDKLGGLGDAAFSDDIFKSERTRRKELTKANEQTRQTTGAAGARRKPPRTLRLANTPGFGTEFQFEREFRERDARNRAANKAAGL